MAKALAGVVVLDLTAEPWAALAAALLGDFGATVVRVERLPEARTRRLAGETPEPAAAWDHRFELANRNKMSLALDLETERGRDVLRRLVAKADVLLTDQPRATLERLGLDHAAVTAVRSDIVYARGTGLGPEGPDRDLPPLDELAAARTGMMPILPQPGQPPVYPGHGQTYTTVMLALGVALALFHRRRTGESPDGRRLLLAGNNTSASLDLQAFLAIRGDRFLHPVSRLDAGNPMSGTLYQTSDGRWVTLTMPETDRWWPALAEIVDLDPKDARFDSHDKRCGANRLELLRLLDERFRRQPAAHWRKLFSERQMSADVIEDYSYPANDPQARRNRYLLDLADASLGPLRLLGFPIFMTDTPARLDRRAPALGQHSAAILHDLLGYGEREIAALEAEGVIA
jgi:formyl-CoA transferase